MNQPKPFEISKRAVWEAYKRVKANRGAAGIDGQSIEEFEQNLSGNLYKLWNRLASGSYIPPAVRRVEIPKASGGTRPLGIPTVADRIAQMVVKDALEPSLEPCFLFMTTPTAIVRTNLRMMPWRSPGSDAGEPNQLHE